MPGSLTIRPATDGDVGALARLHVRSWHETYRGLIPDAEIERRTVDVRIGHVRVWLREPATTTLVAAQPSGALAGFATGHPAAPDGEFGYVLGGLYVLAAAQRAGAGRALVREFARGRLAEGVPSIGLWVLGANAKARAFYEATGATLLRADPSRPWDQVIYVWHDLVALAEADA